MAIPRPPTGVPASPEDIHDWLEYLCCNVTIRATPGTRSVRDIACRGLGGYELIDCEDLLRLTFLDSYAPPDMLHARAEGLRITLRDLYAGPEETATGSSSGRRARLHLLGLSDEAFGQLTPQRRALSSEAMGVSTIDSFRHDYERPLLMDVAYDLWRLHEEAAARPVQRDEACPD